MNVEIATCDVLILGKESSHHPRRIGAAFVCQNVTGQITSRLLLTAALLEELPTRRLLGSYRVSGECIRKCTNQDPPISDGLKPGARGHLGGPRQCLRVDILPNVRQFAISDGNGEDPMVLERLIRGFDSPRSEADDHNPVSLRYELGGALGTKFPPFR